MLKAKTVPLQQSRSHQSDTDGTHQQHLWCFYTIQHSQEADLQKNKTKILMMTTIRCL